MENTILNSAMTVCASSVELNFLVDELLDFPTEFEEELLSSPFIAKSGEASLPHNAPPPLHHPDVMSSNDMPHVKFVDISSATTIEEPSSGLCVPPDELVHQLEWLSSFNDDDCFMEGDTKLLPLTESTSSTRASSDIRVDRCTKEIQMTSRKSRESFNSQSPVSVLEQGSHSYRKPCRMARAYKSHRVRKTRTGGRIWSLDILKPILVNKRAKDAYKRTSLLVTSSSSQAYSESLCPFLREDVLERPFKKMKRVAAEADSGLVRRCTHCLVQKTPQWRAGPQGPKTLCNACGVRYKSGRLVPEYRPAASPSFVSEVHSNSHRRILEMRRAKDVESCVRLYNNKVESREEADEIEAGGPYASHGSCEESMGCKELCVSKGGLLYKEAMPGCKQVEVRGDDGSCTTDDSASGKEFATKGNPEGSACDAVEIDASTCVEESVLVDVRGVQHGSDVSREGCWSVRVGS